MKTKTAIRLAALALLCALTIPLLTSCGGGESTALPRLSGETNMDPLTSILNPASEVRGVWIASVFNIDFPSYPGLGADALRAEIDSILDTCIDNRLNTVFFQVRPASDALYKSELYPVSSFLSTDGALRFDPLEYIVTEAHKKNIFVHAWINPLRVTVSADSEDTLPENSPARLHPEWTVKYADGKLYMNAGIPEVRDYVARGVSEIVSNYDVDGVVFDDYFYPYPVAGADFDDGAAYDKYGEGTDISDWRRQNINELVKACYTAVKEADSHLSFGVSPGGIWRNDNGENGGSATAGFETYESLYCDSLAWIDGGYIDYIAPQLYWTFDNARAPYGELTDWWCRAVDGTDVKLLIAHGAYLYEEGNWESPSGEITEQVEYAREKLNFRGSVYYGYDELRRNTGGVSEEIKKLNENAIVHFSYTAEPAGVVFTSHEDGGEVPVGSVEIRGVSDPTHALYFDGERLTRVTGGAFEVTVEASRGENVFEFEINGAVYTLTLEGTS